MTARIFNVTRLHGLTGSGVPLFEVSQASAGFFLADISIIHHSCRNGVDYHKKHSNMKKKQAKSSKAKAHPVDLERIRLKAYLSPISHSDLRDSLVATLQASGKKVLVIHP